MVHLGAITKILLFSEKVGQWLRDMQKKTELNSK